MMTLQQYAKATSAAQALDNLRARGQNLATGSYYDWLDLAEKLGGEIVFNDYGENYRVESSLHVFPDGSAYYNNDLGEIVYETLLQFIEYREEILNEPIDVPPYTLFTEDEKKAGLKALEPLRERLQKPSASITE